MADQSLTEQSLTITRREWDELQNVLMAVETLNWLDQKGELDQAPLLSLGIGVEIRFRRLVRRMSLRFNPEAPYDDE